MTSRIAIHGFGRIGRMVFRRAIQLGLDVVAVNGTADANTLLHLLKYDSIHGPWKVPIEVSEFGWIVDGKPVHLFNTRNPEEIPWGELDIDVVVEATGKFRTRESASVHMKQGAKKVLITAPVKRADDADVTIVMGVNESSYDPDRHHIISGASCTTNCLGPVVNVIHNAFGVESGLVTTVHAYTNDQLNQDNPHKDLRRARACGQSIIPTSTGAAKAIGLVIPSLQGKLNGISLRVPTPNVSIIDLVAQVEMDVTPEDVNQELLAASNSQELMNILGYTDEPLVSVDFNGDARSAIVDAQSTMTIGKRTVKVLAWYDNEWGYSCRMVDIVRMMDARNKRLDASSFQTIGAV
ncbi:type I glyceraldehyde-3-phosphate dehydrogenase [Alicyclobacillus dauci]|uniref:Glyceraldehyde-3-phosphate dehydrogenase n=1 Tax=Alicyclobacillus dauci TaxID=1475485 RepID=A0ABY6Z7R8_9BACL|nr:type I glyceraldehyde-3-phosphate dehydrogenase [Alicyclobacillus dauci]WAH38216.1 type I glyceraldehyde-3-phosphate dehydrogenase [Alicyclobacillus dauci]